MSIVSRLLRSFLHISFGTERSFIPRYDGMLDACGDLNRDENLRRLLEALIKERWFFRCRKKCDFRCESDAIADEVRRRHGYETEVEGPPPEYLLVSRFLCASDNKARKPACSGYWKNSLYRAQLGVRTVG